MFLKNDLVKDLVHEHIRHMNDCLQKQVQRSDRQINLQRMANQALRSQYDEVHTDYLLVKRILHEVYEDHPEVRMTYRHILDFDDLMTDNDSDDEDWGVARRLDFAEPEVIDLTADE